MEAEGEQSREAEVLDSNPFKHTVQRDPSKSQNWPQLQAGGGHRGRCFSHGCQYLQ